MRTLHLPGVPLAMLHKPSIVERYMNVGDTRSKTRKTAWLSWLHVPVFLLLIAFLLSACGQDSTNPSSSTTAVPTQVPVNGFGTAANHVHSLVAFPNHVL